MVAVALVFGAACTHAKTVGNGKPEAEQQEQSRESKRETSTKTASARADRDTTDSDGVRRNEQGQREIPVATSAAGLLKPGAEKQIDDKLAAGGFLRRSDDAGGTTGSKDDGQRSASSRSEALRRFQEKNNLPATGMPDHETVRKLGLNPNDMFKAGDVSPTDGDARTERR
jgi:hypothetical protein